MPPGPSTPADGGGPIGDGDDGDDPEPDDGGFIGQPDGGSVIECDLYAQDCGAGRKCVPYSSDGSGVFDAVRCAEVAPDPAGKGEPCTWEGEPGAGEEDCGAGLLCWDVDPETHEGVCIELCSGDADSPTCSDPNDVCVGKDFMLCFPRCSPLDDNCPAGCGCYPTNSDFGCFPDASGDMGAQGDECSFNNVCDPGHVCVGADGIDGCEGGSGCCTAFCDLSVGGCPAPHECVPWFEPGEAPIWYENLGACITPS